MSFKLLWLNAYLRSPTFLFPAKGSGYAVDVLTGGIVDSNPEEKDNAFKICDQIINGPVDYDAIAFCEVWDEDCKKLICDCLKNKYPHFVYKIAGEGRGELFIKEDSGLMFFSKYNFKDFNTESIDIEKIRDKYGINSGPKPFWDKPVYFTQYWGRTGDDRFAAKGAAVIRIAVNFEPAGKFFLNIVWTHLQADREPLIRLDQLRQLRSVLYARDEYPYAQPGEGYPFRPNHFDLAHEEIYILGDFNIIGTNVPEDANSNDVCTGDFREWRDRFGSDSDFFKPMYDVWALTTSPWDCGHTDRQRRFDYAFNNGTDWWHKSISDFIDNQLSKKSPDHTIVQHITRPIIGDSDHRALSLDINLPSEYCCPRAAYIIGEVKSKYDRRVSGCLKYKGSMQWYRIEKSGTYALRLPAKFFNKNSESKLAIDVYDKEDLTYPISCYRGEIRELDKGNVIEIKYNFPKPPYYLKVYSRNNDWPSRGIGTYHFDIHKVSGGIPEDAIPIYPNLERDLSLELEPDAFGAGGPIWLRYDVDFAHSSKEQDIKFHLENNSNEDAWLELIAESSQDVVDSDPNEIQKKMVGPSGNRYLRIQRMNGSQIEFKIIWTTNLKFFTGSAIVGADQVMFKCVDETGVDWWGSDEIILKIVADDVTEVFNDEFKVNNRDVRRIDYGLPHSSWYRNLPVVGYISSINVEFIEEDVLLNDGGSLVIKPNVDRAVNQSYEVPVSGGLYEFFYNLTRIPEWCQVDEPEY